MDVLHAWQQASAVVLSCTGPLRRHPKALLPLADLCLPQVFLGGESQLAAFAAAAPARTRQKMLFAPLPEMFSGPEGFSAAFRALGRKAPERGRIVHLRFGGVRDARILKGVVNAAVLGETCVAPPLTASHHPFASGLVLPARMQGVFVYGADGARPRRPGGDALPSVVLPAACVTADLVAERADPRGLDLVRLADFDPDHWAAGAVPPCKPPPRGGVLLPWNLGHFGGIVPDLLARLASLWQPGARLPPLLVLPFNDPGQTGLLRETIARLREAAPHAQALLHHILFARVTRLAGLVPLRKIAPIAWVDGNDPESWWTMARLNHAGFQPILIDPGTADDAIWVESDTRYGKLAFDVRLPSLRALPRLLAMSAMPR